MLSALLTLLALGIAAIVALSVVAALIGTVVSLTFGLIGFLLFKVAPVLLVGWLVLKLVDRSRRAHRLPASSSDQRWLDER